MTFAAADFSEPVQENNIGCTDMTQAKVYGQTIEFNPVDLIKHIVHIRLALSVEINDLRKSMNILRVDHFDNKPTVKELERNMAILEKMSKTLSNLDQSFNKIEDQ